MLLKKASSTEKKKTLGTGTKSPPVRTVCLYTSLLLCVHTGGVIVVGLLKSTSQCVEKHFFNVNILLINAQRGDLN